MDYKKRDDKAAPLELDTLLLQLSALGILGHEVEEQHLARSMESQDSAKKSATVETKPEPTRKVSSTSRHMHGMSQAPAVTVQMEFPVTQLQKSVDILYDTESTGASVSMSNVALDKTLASSSNLRLSVVNSVATHQSL